MKNLMNYMLCTLLVTGAFSATYAQTQPQVSPSQNSQEPSVINDATLSERLQKDLSTRNNTIGTAPIGWYDAGYGYYGTYNVGDVNYMSRYDREGKYVETLKRGEWNANVPSSLRSSFDQSTYKSQSVTGYWETSDPSRKGYYLELKDDKGKMSRVWADEKGTFTTQPYSPTGTPPKQ